MNRLVINADLGTQRISRHIYGHFAEHLGRCIYEGIWVGEDSPIPNTRGIRNDVVEALKRLKMPNLRWPGGCFADTYHWKDGIGLREKRPSIVNIHWGGVTETNHFGTHEFMDFCSLIDTEPYVCGNVGSGTVQEMAEWLEYITMPGKSPMADLRRANGREEAWPITYWAVGNENWGCGGNMRPEYYADLYRRFATYCRNFSGARLYKVACGYEDAWNEVLMREAHNFMDGLSVHYYTFTNGWDGKGPATGFPEGDWYKVLKNALGIEDFIKRTATIMDRYDPEKRVGMIIDEWGTWYNVEPGTNPGFLYQQNTILDALVAGSSLNIMHQYADRIHMANIAQTINVLQSMILTEGAKMLLTPTYHLFEMYKVHQNATLLPTNLDTDTVADDNIELPKVSASASRDDSGKTNISLCNLAPNEAVTLNIELRGAKAQNISGLILTANAMDAHNTFEQPDTVMPTAFTGFQATAEGVSVTLPAKSVVVLEVV